MILLAFQNPIEPTRSASLTPPRPNPGPEPWRDDFPAAAWLVLFLPAVAAGLAFAWTRRRRRRTSAVPPAHIAADDSPEARLLILCNRLRDAMASRLGPGLRAWTTEEIASDPQTIDLLKDDRDQLTVILRTGDRLKFASRERIMGLEEQLADWTTWADSLEASLRRK